jgi:probable O-glycosylation ligase (exosortase A-associated)
MAVPLLVGIAQSDSKRWVRVTAVILASLTVVTVLFTFSRGGLLTLAAGGLMLVVRSRQKVLLGFFLVLSVGSFFLLSSERIRTSYLERAQTIGSYQEDASAMGRVGEWKTALRIYGDYPVFGVGPDNLRAVHQKYSEASRYKVTHNTFLQLLVEAGLPAVVLLTSTIIVTLIQLERLRKRSTNEQLATYASSLQVAIVAFLVGGSFLDKAYYDLIYHLIAMSVCLQVVETGGAEEAESETAEDLLGSRETAWWRHEPTPRVAKRGLLVGRDTRIATANWC